MFPFDGDGEGFGVEEAILAGTIMGVAHDDGMAIAEEESEAKRQVVEDLYHELDALEANDRTPGMHHISSRRPAQNNKDWPVFEQFADDHIHGRRGLHDD